MDLQNSGDVFSYPHHIRRVRGSVPTELSGGIDFGKSKKNEKIDFFEN